MSRLLAVAFAVGLVMAFLGEAQGQVGYSISGSTYSQNFDSLPNSPENVSLGNSPVGWIDNTASPGANQFSIVGWYLLHPLSLTEGGASGNQRMRIGAGTANTGGFMSFGSSGSTERALGDVGSATLAANGADIYLGLRLRNDTGQTLDSFTLSYNGEQWRDGGNATPVAQSMTFAWSTTATGITNGSFTTQAALGYDSPVFTATAGAVDGNNAGRVVVGPVTVTGLNWVPGADLWLRWDDIQNTGNDHGLAIDDVNVSAAAAVPEPTTWALFAIGVLTLLGFRRRRN
jgi:hypothetical protein